MFRQGLVFMLAFGLLTTAGFAQPKTGVRHVPEISPYYMSINVVDAVIPGEPAKLEAFLKSWHFLDTIVVVFKPLGAIQYSGKTEWRQVVNSGDSIVFPLEVTFGINDTSGFELVAYKNGSVFFGDGFYVVSTGDSVKMFASDPRNLPKDSGLRYSKEFSELLNRPKTSSELNDTTKVKVTTYKPTEWERMKEKERTPNTKYTAECIRVDGETWCRRKGEYEFRKMGRPATREEILQNLGAGQTKLDDEYRDSTRDIVMDLRDTVDFNYIRNLFGDRLLPMDSAGFYHALITKPESRRVTSRSIRYSIYPKYPLDTHEPTQEERDEQEQRKLELKKKSSAAPQGKAPKDVLVSYTFEELGFWIDNWNSYDNNYKNGRDYWKDVYLDSGEVLSGEFSAWCAADGNMPDGVQYDDYMAAWMEPWEGIDVSGHENIKLIYWLWYDTEYKYDYFQSFYSYDGETWEVATDSVTGTSWGWEEFTIGIPKDGDSVFFAFLFYSDSSYCDYRGAFLEDISVTGESTEPLPNLTYTNPIWWDCPVVPSSVPGTNDTSNLCGNSPTYIDVAITNSGNVSTSGFYVTVYIDGGILDTTYECWGYLLPGADKYFEDHKAYITSGYHSLTMVIDTGNLIEETCETDNVYERVFYWSAPGTVTISGYITYEDMNPPGSYEPVRNVLIVLLDKDEVGSDFMGMATTESNGHFSCGPFSNADDQWQGRQDVYLWIYPNNGAADIHNGIQIFTDTVIDIPDGYQYLGESRISAPASGEFYIMDKILDGRDRWISLGQSNPGCTGVIIRNGGGSEYLTDSCIIIDSSASTYYSSPDVYDEYVILHEYGHFLENANKFFHGFAASEHQWQMPSGLQTAASEGFAHFWPAVVTDNAIQTNHYNNFVYSRVKNMETGEYGDNGIITGSANDIGPDCEGTVAGVLWDLYDNDDDDYTTWKPGYPGVGQQDGIWDSLDNGIYSILECLTARDAIPGQHPIHIYNFWDVWFQSPSLGENQKLWGVFREHGTGLEMDIVGPTGSIVIKYGDSITSSLFVPLALWATDTLSGMMPPLAQMQFSNDGNTWAPWVEYTNLVACNLSSYGGNTRQGTKTVYAQFKDASGNQSIIYSDDIIYFLYLCGDATADGKIGIGDAVMIITYIFRSGPPPVPMEAGDANCDSNLNVVDAVYIVNYIFRGGPEPCCP